MNHPAHSDLKAFARSGDEAAFGRVVEALGGLVFSSALQRTGDRSMAEEVAQNVFAVLARKAKRVAKHPSLEGWVFTTTRLESITAMRKRGQHQRKVSALTEATAVETMTNDAPDTETWAEALPELQAGLDRLSESEREILLARFYSDNSFKEIAQRFGKTEAACKMRIKRSLEKLNSWLAGKGVKLSAAAIATGMSSEWAGAAVPANLATNALGAAPALSATTILTNTFITMNTLKQGGLIVATVLVLGSVPVLIQHGRANQLQQEIDQLEISDPRTANPALSATPERADQNSPADQFLRQAFVIGDPSEFANRLARAQMRNDMLELTRIFAAVSRLSDQELNQLVADVANAEISPQAKRHASSLLARLAGLRNEVGESVFDEMLAEGQNMRVLERALTQFASDKPAEALRWYQSRRDDGRIDGKGTRTMQSKAIIEALVDGFAQSDPAAAIKILDDLDGSEDERRRIEGRMLGGLIRAGADGRAIALDYAAAQPDIGNRGDLVKYASVVATSRGADIDETARFLFEADISERARASALTSLPNNLGEKSMTIAETGDWLVTKLGPGEVGTIEGFVYDALRTNPEETQQWIDSLPSGDVLDRVTRKQGEMRQREDDYSGAVEYFDTIADEANRTEALQRTLRRWQREDPAAARAAAEARGIKLR